MGNVNKVVKWLGIKMGVTITHANGMIESYEESSGGSLEAWVDKGDTPAALSNQLLGMLQIQTHADEVRIMSKIRELASSHAGPTIPQVHREILDRPPAEMPDQGEEPKDQVQKSLDEEDGDWDAVFWFGKQEGKMVSECSTGSLQWHVNQGDIYKNGKKDKAEVDDPQAYQLARAIDWQLTKKKKEK